MVTTNGAIRCAEWALAQDVDPCGTAGHHDIFVAVECPGPWPRDVSELPDLRSVRDLGDTVRVVAVAPRPDNASGRLVTVWRGSSGTATDLPAMVGVDHLVAPGTDLATELTGVIDGTSAQITSREAAPRDLFICGHGRRDRCCGRMGVQLQQATSTRWAGVRVRRSSHLGGHRFAPTAVTMPDNRWWAFLTVDALDRIVNCDLDAALLRRHYRGSGLLDGRAQHVERQLLGSNAGGISFTFRQTAAVEQSDGTSTQIELEWVEGNSRRRASAVVEDGPPAPFPTCGTKLLELAKSEPSFQLRSIDLERS